MRLAAAMIVRDEARFLPGCLESLRGIVDEVVVVDTGSADASADIAAAHGAQVARHEWQADFSAARNRALDLVGTANDWVLYIDADERLRPYDRARLDQELADPRLVGCTLRFHPRTGYTAYREYRLFRRDPHLRFVGAMHETIVPALQRLVAAGGRIGSAALTIDHLGYDGDQSHKLARNLALLTRQIAADPERLYLRWHLGTVYRDLGRLSDAVTAWAEGVRLARRGHAPPQERGLCFVELAQLALAQGQNPLPLLAEGIALAPDNWLLHWLKGRVLLAQRRLDEAAQIFDLLARIDPATLVADAAYQAELFGAPACALMAEAAFALERYVESADWFARAEALAPDSLEWRTKCRLAAARAAKLAGHAA